MKHEHKAMLKVIWGPYRETSIGGQGVHPEGSWEQRELCGGREQPQEATMVRYFRQNAASADPGGEVLGTFRGGLWVNPQGMCFQRSPFPQVYLPGHMHVL